MAKKVMQRSGAQDARNPTPQVMRAKVTLESSVDTPVYYVNHAEVTQGRHDFGIAFTRLPNKFTPRQIEEVSRTGTFVTEPMLQLVIPPTMMPGLIRALTLQLEQYEKSVGPIKADAGTAQKVSPRKR